MIQFKQVTKRYTGNNFSIENLNFVVDPGEFVFLIGPSGSGKTTVIKMLTREELPTSGQIYFDDFDITRLSRDSVYRVRRQIGVVFQDYKLIPDKTVYENVAFAMEVAGKKEHQIKETVPYLLDIVGLADRAKAFPSHLSGGEKQRVAIARAVSNNPRVLIADEPTGNLDPAAAWDIVQILSKINNWGTTVIMSTHGTDIVNTLNKRVIQMEGGRLIRDDKHGYYEHVNLSDEEKERIEEKKTEIKKARGPIKVSLNKKGDGEGNENLSVWPFRRRRNSFTSGFREDADETMPPNVEEENQQAEKASREAQEEAHKLLRIMADADNIPLETLGLSQMLTERLNSAGYKDIEDLISAGPEQLFKEQLIDMDDVRKIAKSVEAFISQEEEKIAEEDEEREEQKEEVKPKPKKKKQTKKAKLEKETDDDSEHESETDDEKPRSRAVKIKLDLTGKKKS